MSTEAVKVLGQAMPSINTTTAIYTCAATGGAAISSVLIANLNSGGGAANVRVSIAVGGAADSYPSSQYILNALLTINNAIEIADGISLADTDVVRCWSDTANISFTVSGVEVTL